MPLPAKWNEIQDGIPKEIKNPTVKPEPTRHKISVFGIVNNNDGRFVYSINPVFNAQLFLNT